ncbi:MAG: threonylcarbamoyl-AMP synthase [Clostridia bacterium]|nr:threonylcarbamoyl-AMP synthase [Clostridia bacterium]
METHLLHFNDDDLQLAGQLIQQGQLVAFPTETVYGLGANALDRDAVQGIFAAKGRPSDNPLIVHVANASQISQVAHCDNADVQRVVEAFMPGSLTVVLPKRDVVPDVVTAGLNTVAVRMPGSKQALSFLSACQVPVAAPSANTSTRPSPTNWQTVRDDMDGKIAAILCGDDCAVGIESTVLDMTQPTPTVLRPGVVTPSQISKVLGKPVKVVTNPTAKVNSPGVKYKHYAPNCEMVLNVDGDVQKICAFYDAQAAQGKRVVILAQQAQGFGNRSVKLLGSTDEAVAQGLFASLRQCETNFDLIIASYTSTTELAHSILNRLTKSAGQKIL